MTTEPTPMTEMSFEITASVLGRTMVGQGLIAEARRSRSEETRLRAALAAKEAECERLGVALSKYANHQRACSIGPCDCGFNAWVSGDDAE